MKYKKKYKYLNKRNIKSIINNRYQVLLIFMIFIFTIIILRLFQVQIIEYKKHKKYVENATVKIIEGSSAPRGRIYDRNMKVLVDNKVVKKITYTYRNNITTQDEIDMAYYLVSLIDIDYTYLYKTNLKEFYMVTHKEEVNSKITDEEREKLTNREITENDIYNYKIERITDEELSNLTDIDKKAAYVYYLMNKGYYYEEKTIKTNLDDLEYAKVAENLDKLKGFNTKIDWERYYPYEDTFRSILGTLYNCLPSDNLDYYLNLGYSLNDRVGASYLEYQYESILKGTKNKYIINKDGSYSLYEEGKRGNDIVLTIDIQLQQEVENILKSQVIAGMKELYFGYFNRGYVVIQNLKGEILALAGIQGIYKDGDYKTYDTTSTILTNPIVPGSSVKGASHIVGYNNNALKIGEVRDDFCIKIASTPLKCSWKELPALNDITALKQSSNSYQYQTAIKVGNGKYSYNKPLSIDKEAFNKYRDVYAQFGLGVSTGIDLPVESKGYIGTSTDSGFLLDLAIGQYDNYTPIQLSQYITTIANDGNRMQMHLLKKVYNSLDNSLIYEVSPNILNKVDTKEEYMARVKEGFKAVMESGGTGYGYIDSKYLPAGKTGTSDGFIDTDNDNIVDTKTINNTFVSYAPYDNPEVTFTIVTPDVGYYTSNQAHRTYIITKISQLVSKKYFEIYK